MNRVLLYSRCKGVKDEELFYLNSLATHPTTQPQIPQDLNLQSHRCKNLVWQSQDMLVQRAFMSEKQDHNLIHVRRWQQRGTTYLRIRSCVKAERPAYVLIGTSSATPMTPPSRFQAWQRSLALSELSALFALPFTWASPPPHSSSNTIYDYCNTWIHFLSLLYHASFQHTK